MLPPRDPSAPPPPRIPLRVPAGGRPRPSRPRTKHKVVWALLLFAGVAFPATNEIAQSLAPGRDIWVRLLITLWAGLVNAIIFAAATVIFKFNKKD
jgi:VanZ family protein